MTKYSWTLEVDEEGMVILPEELLDQLGWDDETELVWSETEDGFRLEKVSPDNAPQQDDS